MIDFEAVNERHQKAVECGRNLHHAHSLDVVALLKSCSDIPELLEHIMDLENRVFAPGECVARTEYGVIALEEPRVMAIVGDDLAAYKWSTHQRNVVVWPQDGVPPQDWAKYTSGWVKKVER